MHTYKDSIYSLAIAAVLGLCASPVWAEMQHQPSTGSPDQHNMLQGNRLVIGTIEKITGEQIQVNTGEMQPRYLPLGMAKDKDLPALKEGDRLEIVLNEQNLVVDYHPVGTPFSHRRVTGQLVTSMVVGHDQAVIKTQDGKEESHEVRPMARSKMSSIPIGSQAVFLIDETNQIADVIFGNEKAVDRAADEYSSSTWKGSPLKGAQNRLAGTVVKPLEGGRITIRTDEGKERP